MPRPGALNKRATFERRAVEDDGYGNTEGAWQPLLTVWASLQLADGRETVRAGALTSTLPGVLRVRYSAQTKGITAGDRAMIEGDAYQIRTVANRDQRHRYIEMVVEKGVAT